MGSYQREGGVTARIMPLLAHRRAYIWGGGGFDHRGFDMGLKGVSEIQIILSERCQFVRY